MLTASLPLVKVGLPGLRPASRRPGRSWSAPRRLAQRLVCQAGGGADGGNGGGPEPPSNSKDEEKTKRIKEVEANLKQLGIDRSTAKRVLEIWKQAGATSPESLRNVGGVSSGAGAGEGGSCAARLSRCVLGVRAAVSFLLAHSRASTAQLLALHAPPPPHHPTPLHLHPACPRPPRPLPSPQLFVKRSLSKSVTLLVQLALDVLASGGAFYTGVAIGQSNAFGTYTLAIQYLAYFLVGVLGEWVGWGGGGGVGEGNLHGVGWLWGLWELDEWAWTG